MAQKNIHPESYPITIETSDGFSFSSFSTKNMGGKVLYSDFSEKLLPWNRTSFGAASEKDVRIKKQIERQGTSYASLAGIITGKK